MQHLKITVIMLVFGLQLDCPYQLLAKGRCDKNISQQDGHTAEDRFNAMFKKSSDLKKHQQLKIINGIS